MTYKKIKKTNFKNKVDKNTSHSYNEHMNNYSYEREDERWGPMK